MTTAPATWVLLVPSTLEWLRPRARALWDARYEPVKDEVPDWELRAGSGGYVALIDRERGSEGTDEPVARELSRQLDQPVVLLRLREEAELVRVFEHGDRVRDEAEAPISVAERLGVTL